MLISHWYKMPAGVTLVVVITVLTSTVVSSIWLRKIKESRRKAS
ncbi:MAG TPA: hypothetical protein VEC56_02785 [Candidatus Krumholzibacteria bacterium]|nr:hypothetical protein [Candidatus Krumholzibacteria bacterium]